jgi:hypothetical protein
VGFDALIRNHHDFAVLDLADELRADDVEGTGFRTKNVGAVELTQYERADAERVAGADQFLVGQRHEGVGAFEAAQRIDVAINNAALFRARDEMQDHFRVGRRLANGTLADEFAAQRQAVGDIAIVGDSEAARRKFGKQRLDIAQDGLAGGGIADMSKA